MGASPGRDVVCLPRICKSFPRLSNFPKGFPHLLVCFPFNGYITCSICWRSNCNFEAWISDVKSLAGQVWTNPNANLNIFKYYCWILLTNQCILTIFNYYSNIQYIWSSPNSMYFWHLWLISRIDVRTSLLSNQEEQANDEPQCSLSL